MKILKYVSTAHLNSYSLCLMVNDDNTISAVGEELPTGNSWRIKDFYSEKEALDWWENTPGTGLFKLANALNR